MSDRFNELPAAPVDQIMIANANWPNFLAVHPDAINTTIGVIINPENSWPWQPHTVREARKRALQETLNAGAYGYQTPAGYAAFLAATGEKVFGTEAYFEHADEVLAYQTLGGTGSLFLAKDILADLMQPDSEGHIPAVLDAGWPNHPAIFAKPFETRQYQHMDPETGAYNHQAALDAFGDAPDNAVFILQTAGYNDDGMDRSQQQWDEILEIAQAKNATVILDSAYLGLVNGFALER